MEESLDKLRKVLDYTIIQHNFRLIDEEVIKISTLMDKLINDYMVKQIC
ncbi:MAG: aspartyl-phosphate phosphatase Spo0E family protein [Bacillota bacterium]|nr:aspartyl-phosphate phosphatase Spo0E family protein [Bacillota bacterium]